MNGKTIAIGLATLGAIGFAICGNFLYNNSGLVPYLVGGAAGICGWAFGTGWALFNLHPSMMKEKDE